MPQTIDKYENREEADGGPVRPSVFGATFRAHYIQRHRQFRVPQTTPDENIQKPDACSRHIKHRRLEKFVLRVLVQGGGKCGRGSRIIFVRSESDFRIGHDLETVSILHQDSKFC